MRRGVDPRWPGNFAGVKRSKVAALDTWTRKIERRFAPVADEEPFASSSATALDKHTVNNFRNRCSSLDNALLWPIGFNFFGWTDAGGLQPAPLTRHSLQGSSHVDLTLPKSRRVTLRSQGAKDGAVIAVRDKVLLSFGDPLLQTFVTPWYLRLDDTPRGVGPKRRPPQRKGQPAAR